VRRLAKSGDELFIVVEGGSQALQGGWPALVVQIQCFDFCLRGEVMGQSIAKR
jgi:hypothetical protein